MAILLLLLLGTLCIIYSSSYYEVSERNREMLERYAALYSLEEQPGEERKYDDGPEAGGIEPDRDEPNYSESDSDEPNYGESGSDELYYGESDSDELYYGESGSDELRLNEPDMGGPFVEEARAFQLSTFYSVAVSETGTVLGTDNEEQTAYSDEELAELAGRIIESGKESGIRDNLIYLRTDKDGYSLVAFMDNTIIQESMTTLFRYTLIFGSAAILVLFFISGYLARKIIQPLEESYHKQKQFISDAGHELKTPVSVVNTNAELLSREIGENQWLANIQYENERMGALVTQLLELARTENVALQMEYIDFSRLVRGETLPFEGIAFEKELTFSYDITDNLHVCGNSVQLKQLVSILLDNAVNHCRERHEIKVMLKCERNAAVLSVINDGDVIPDEQRRQIFERFYRVDDARNGDGKHYGLGLAIAKAIVTAHKGKIEVLCRGGKVEFEVRIPMQK